MPVRQAGPPAQVRDGRLDQAHGAVGAGAGAPPVAEARRAPPGGVGGEAVVQRAAVQAGGGHRQQQAHSVAAEGAEGAAGDPAAALIGTAEQVRGEGADGAQPPLRSTEGHGHRVHLQAQVLDALGRLPDALAGLPGEARRLHLAAQDGAVAEARLSIDCVEEEVVEVGEDGDALAPQAAHQHARHLGEDQRRGGPAEGITVKRHSSPGTRKVR